MHASSLATLLCQHVWPMHADIMRVPLGISTDMCAGQKQQCSCSVNSYPIPVGLHACHEPLHVGTESTSISSLPKDLCRFYSKVHFC
jgi:hypothetical protein